MFEHVTDTRYIPLALLYGVGGRMQFVDLMNQTVALSTLDVLQTKVLLKTMRGQSLISGDFSASSSVHLEQPGAELFLSLQKEAKERLQLAEKEADQAAKDERQQRFDNKISEATLLVNLVFFIVGLVAEHFIGIVRFFASLFH